MESSHNSGHEHKEKAHKTNHDKNHFNHRSSDSDESLHMFPLFTWILILVLIGSFLLQIFYLNSNPALIGNLMTSPEHLFEGNFFSILTSIFLHANIVHLLVNLVALYAFGKIVEKHYGIKVVLIFLGSGLIANLVSHGISIFLNDIFFSLGASGAIAGIIMFALMTEPLSTKAIPYIPIPLFILGWFLILLDIVGLSNPSTTNHYAHLGGYSALLILFFLLNVHQRQKILLGFILNVVILVVAVFVLQFFNVEIVNNLF